MPKVSVIIPTYNRGNIVTQAIDSVINQTYKDYEIIIIDDGSTDNTKEILDPYLSKSNIDYIYQENKKQAAARNTGIRNSKGEYIAFLDSDDLWHPEKLELQVKILEENPAVGMVYSNQSLIKDNSSEDKIKYPLGVLKSGNIFEDLLLRRFYCSTPTLLIRKSVLDDVGLLDESLKNALEDWELTLRVAQKYSVFCIDKPLIQRRTHDTPSENYFEIRIDNHRSILNSYLNESDLPKSFINLVWTKAYFSWGHSCFKNYRYQKAFKYFSHALLKGYWKAGAAMLLCIFGPIGKKIFERLLQLKSKVN